MKKYRKTGTALLAAALLCAGSAVQAELMVNSKDDLNGEEWKTINGITAPKEEFRNNEVTIGSDGTSPDLSGKYISGGYSDTTAVSGNSVTMKSGTVSALYGGYGQSAESVLGNTVNFSGDTVNYVYGGWSENGSAESNTVTLSGNGKATYVYGGYGLQGTASDNTVTVSGVTVEAVVYGGYSVDGSAENTVTLSSGTVKGVVYGGWSGNGSAERNTVTISGGTVTEPMYGAYVYGGYSVRQNATGNSVILSGGTVKTSVYGGYSENGSATDNTVTLTGTANAEGANLYGSNKEVSEDNSGNKLVVDNWSGSVGGLHNFESIEFQNVKLSEDGTAASSLEVAANGAVENIGGVKITSLAAGDYAAGTNLKAAVTWESNIQDAEADVAAVEGQKWFTADRNEGGLYANQYDTIVAQSTEEGTRKVMLTSTVTASALTGKFIDADGTAHYNSAYTPDENGTGQTLVISEGFTTNVDTVAGAYAVGSQNATGGQLYITGNPADGFTKTIYAGYSESGNANGNDVYIGNADHAVHADRVILRGDNGNGSDNTLHVTGTGNTIGSVSNFDALSFDNLTWKDGATVLSITGETKDKQLSGTEVSVNGLSLAGGTTLSAGQSMTLLESTQNMGLGDAKDIPLNGADDFTAGVAAVGKGTMAISEDGKQLTYTIDRVGLNPQTLTIAENRTAAAAFLNQGADIAADSLDLLGSDYQYGLRTFGAVYGSRSTYDAAGDLKINGWSEIVGLGNVHRKGDGDLSWGVFYENGTGNYRTWNEFNNEMFRGDGSLLYNGGGAAVRYQKDNGWYYEASVRAGTLSASMDNAVKDGKGNSYGFDSDSTYWGAHAGVGKVIETEQGEWNVYGKYFHTDIDGDSFAIAGDTFTFDSLTSDRLRIGARYTADKVKRWSLYYGLAWEYEFTGDSHMRAAGMTAPEQSLGGSTGIAEIGTVWQTDDSPWQANINLKGYAGEREGVSGMVQLAYTF